MGFCQITMFILTIGLSSKMYDWFQWQLSMIGESNLAFMLNIKCFDIEGINIVYIVADIFGKRIFMRAKCKRWMINGGISWNWNC